MKTFLPNSISLKTRTSCSPGAAGHECVAINPKSQIPNPKKTPNPKSQTSQPRPVFKFGVWDFFGIWDLGLGVSPRRPRNTEHGTRRTSPSSGIALVITLILLAIITFLAITLLVVTRSEKGTVGVKADQTTAALAADAALEQVKLDLLAPMIAFTNPNNFELLVSTNYVNPLGFFASLPGNSNPYTNVNYERTSAGAALTPAQMLQNLENLNYAPRPPVFMTNRLAGAAGSNELRYFRDENRNGQFDATGLLPVVGLNGSYFDTN